MVRAETLAITGRRRLNCERCTMPRDARDELRREARGDQLVVLVALVDHADRAGGRPRGTRSRARARRSGRCQRSADGCFSTIGCGHADVLGERPDLRLVEVAERDSAPTPCRRAACRSRAAARSCCWCRARAPLPARRVVVEDRHALARHLVAAPERASASGKRAK